MCGSFWNDSCYFLERISISELFIMKLCYTHLNMSTLELVWVSTINNDCLLYLMGEIALNHLRQSAARDVFQILMFTTVCGQAVCLKRRFITIIYRSYKCCFLYYRDGRFTCVSEIKSLSFL